MIEQEEKLKPKILVNTVDCWNSHIGSNTLSSWLTGYDSENLANIYIREEVPDSEVCSRYFKISENKVFKSLFLRGLPTGKEYIAGDISQDTQDVSNLRIQNKGYQFFKKIRLWLFLYMREIFWKLGNWQSKELDMFLDDFKPDIVLAPLEVYIHFNRINQYIIKKTGAKAIGVFWDDNFTYKPHKWNIGFRIHRFFLKRNIEKSVELCDKIFAISPQMKAECDRLFRIESTVLTKPISSNDIELVQNRNIEPPLKMIYTGNLLIGRDKTLKLLLKAIKEINLEKTEITLDIYTTTNLTKKLTKAVIETPGCSFKGALPQSEVIEKQKQADVLIFMEALSGKDKYSARLSFSTKLTDYFAAGKCIFALGPRDIAPIEYLLQEDAAVVASNYKGIVKGIQRLLNPELIGEYGKKAFDCGKRNHSGENVKNIFKETINELYVETKRH